MNPHESAAERLARNRVHARRWLERDQSKRSQFNDSKLGQLTQLPWLRQLTAHPVTGMALTALTRWWMRPKKARSGSPTVGMLAAGAGLGLLRRRPLLTLVTTAAVVAVLLLKNRNRRLPPPTP